VCSEVVLNPGVLLDQVSRDEVKGGGGLDDLAVVDRHDGLGIAGFNQTGVHGLDGSQTAGEFLAWKR